MNISGEQNVIDDLLHSPLGVLALTRCIIEVSGTPPGMPFAERLGRYSAQDMARCLQALSMREASSSYFDQLPAERLSELIAQCEADLTPYWDGYQQQAEVLLALSASLRPLWLGGRKYRVAALGLWQCGTFARWWVKRRASGSVRSFRIALPEGTHLPTAFAFLLRKGDGSICLSPCKPRWGRLFPFSTQAGLLNALSGKRSRGSVSTAS